MVKEGWVGLVCVWGGGGGGGEEQGGGQVDSTNQEKYILFILNLLSKRIMRSEVPDIL